MASQRETGAAIARVYAGALLDVAEERGEAEGLRDELADLAGAIERDRDLAHFLASPRVDSDARRDTLERVFRDRASDLLTDTLQVLNRKRRIELLPAVATAYAHELNRRRGRLEVTVISAVALAPAQRDRIAAAIAARTGREPVLREEIEPALIGGVVVRIGDRKIDGSVATKIERLSQALVARASRQIHTGAHFAE